MSSLLLLGVFVALIAVVSPPHQHDSLQNGTLSLATSVKCNCSKPSLFVETSNEVTVANGPGREFCAFPTSSPLQGAKGELYFADFSSLLGGLPSVVSVTGSRAEGTKRDATLPSHLPAVCAFIVLLFIGLAVVYRHSDGARSIGSVDRTSKKRESRQIVALSRTFLVVVVIAIASVEGRGSNAPDSGQIVRCGNCSSPFTCTPRSLGLFISSVSLNWFDAETECSKHGGALFSIRNTDDVSNLENYLRCQLPKLSRKELYFGLIRTPTTEENTYNYRWSDGSPFSSDPWVPTGWSRSKDPVCFTLIAKGYVIKWGRTVSCLKQLGYICQRQPKGQPFVDFPIRLVGVTPYRGHLEKFHIGAWSPVCMPTSSDKANLIAADACRKMGYNSVLDVTLKSGSSACVYYNCTSNFLDLGNCTSFGGSGFVSCRGSDVDSIFVRLSARVEDWLPFSDGVLLGADLERPRFLIGGLWRPICDGRGGLGAALCRSLGFDYSKVATYGDHSRRGTQALMACSSREIEKCTVTEAQHCNSIVRFRCSADSGKARLVDGLHESEGRVEVFISTSWRSGTWNGVCNDKRVVNNSNVVCRQLGYEKAVAISARRRGLPLPSFDAMYHVRCNGNETSLNECAKERSNRSCKAAEVTCKESEFCPSGWYLFGDYCYTVSNKFYTFSDTEWNKGCSYESLVSISSPHEQAFIVSLLAESDADVWIGLTRRDSDGFHWVNGDRMTPVRKIS